MMNFQGKRQSINGNSMMIQMLELSSKTFTVAVVSIFIEVKLSVLDMNGKLEILRTDNLVNVSYVFRKICILCLWLLCSIRSSVLIIFFQTSVFLLTFLPAFYKIS